MVLVIHTIPAEALSLAELLRRSKINTQRQLRRHFLLATILCLKHYLLTRLGLMQSLLTATVMLDPKSLGSRSSHSASDRVL